MTDVCVFGGSGFLGSFVADALSNSGHRVRIFDRWPSQWAKQGQEMVIGDILDGVAVKEAVSGCKYVYNFAALSDLNEGLSSPLETIRVNILGNGNILEACRECNVNRVLYASTVYVYSRQGGFYRCSKQASELYVEEFQRCYGLDYTILRFGSLYGPRSDQANSLYRIVKHAIETGRLSYKGSVDAMREYIHVEDAARASVDALREEYKNESLVLTGQESMRVVDMLEMLAEILDVSYPVEFLASNDPGHYVRTPYSYQSKVGRKYVPSAHVDLGQGLLQLIEYVEMQAKA